MLINFSSLVLKSEDRDDTIRRRTLAMIKMRERKLGYRLPEKDICWESGNSYHRANDDNYCKHCGVYLDPTVHKVKTDLKKLLEGHRDVGISYPTNP